MSTNFRASPFCLRCSSMRPHFGHLALPNFHGVSRYPSMRLAACCLARLIKLASLAAQKTCVSLRHAHCRIAPVATDLTPRLYSMIDNGHAALFSIPSAARISVTKPSTPISVPHPYTPYTFTGLTSILRSLIFCTDPPFRHFSTNASASWTFGEFKLHLS